MMYFRGMVGFVICLGLVASASAEVLPPSIDIGSTIIAGDSTTEVVEIYVTGGGDVSGLQIFAQIGDGDGVGAEPEFASVSFPSGFWGNGTGSPAGNPKFSLMGSGALGSLAELGIVFDDADQVTLDSTPRLVATLTIDTTGFSSGTFPLMLSIPDYSADSYFLDTSGDPVFPTVIQGSITIIPEPATLSLLALGGLAVLRRRSR